MKEIINEHWYFFCLWMGVAFLGIFLSFGFKAIYELKSKALTITGIVCIVFILFIWSVKLW